MKKLTFHLIANAHLDPVWLWDWREGLNEGIMTSRAVLDMMDEYPDLTFVRGEAALYEHIERTDPETFERIREYVKAGRWDVVGGTYVQMDTNLPATETFARHLCIAQNYFLSRFGKRARVGWAADSFGHSGGLPSILAAAGMKGYAFSRPGEDTVPISKAAFWWEGPDGARVLAYRPLWASYGSERHTTLSLLDNCLKWKDRIGVKNIGIFYGLGNHGGGPSRRMLREIRDWKRAHPEVNVVHSGLHGLIESLLEEGKRNGDDYFPVHRGELNFTLRGCYSSAARFKSAYRRLEAGMARAERIETAVDAFLGRRPCTDALRERAWKSVLFNSFHDILPGSSIERVYDEQSDWVGSGAHAAREIEFDALNALAARIDTRVPKAQVDHPGAVPLLVFNPHPHRYVGAVELEASLDHRPAWAYKGRPDDLPVEVRGAGGRPIAFQDIELESAETFPLLPTRKRVLVPVSLPPMGWNVFSMAWVEGAQTPVDRQGKPASARGNSEISNGIYRVTARKGACGIKVFRKGKPVFKGAGLGAVTVKDPWGAWGSENDFPESVSLSEVLHEWRVVDVRVKERGPMRATLWVLFEGGVSRMALTISLLRDRDAVDVSGRVTWNQSRARLNLAMPVSADAVECDVPGGAMTRGQVGEMPGGRWARAMSRKHPVMGFASDSFYSFELRRGTLFATVTRAAHFARTSCKGWDPEDGLWTPPPWRAVMDQGEHRFRFLLSPGDEGLVRLATELEQPTVTLQVAAHNGELQKQGSILKLDPANVRALALKPAEDGRGWILRIQETEGRSARVRMAWPGRKLDFGRIDPRSIVTFRIRPVRGMLKVEKTDIVEQRVL